MIKTQDIIKQLSSPTKINITCHILHQPEGMCVSKLTEKTGFNRTNVSKQINEMKEKGLLSMKNEGRHNYYLLSSDLHERQKIMINEIVNSYHVVDEKKTNIKLLGSINE